MLGLGLMKAANSFKTFLINANANDLNLFSIAGSPSVKGKYRFIVQPGVTVGQVNQAAGAMVLGAFPAGSEVEIFNNGSIIGKGGLGGGTSSNPSIAGTAGGDALRLDYANITVRLTNNNVIAGGGGGGGQGGYGGAGGTGGRGNITGTTGWIQPQSAYEWYIFDAVPNDNHVSWPGLGWSDSNGPSETLMLTNQVLFEKGDYWGHTQDANPHNSWYIRYHDLQPGGAGGARRAGGSGGNGQGYNQGVSNGLGGLSSLAGSVGTNGAGNGGASGTSGAGGNGGTYGLVGNGGTGGSAGVAGTGGVAGGYSGGEAGASGEAAGSIGAAGLPGRGIVKNALTTLTNNGTVYGSVV